MANKIYEKINKNFNKSDIIIVFLIILLLLSFIKIPYYIQGTGGLENLNKKIIIDGEYKSKGSFNLAYVSEYSPSVLSYLLSLISPNIDAIKQEEILNENDTRESEESRSKLDLKEATDMAVIVGYEKAGKDVIIKKEDVYVTYLLKDADTDIVVGDLIKKVNNIDITSKEQFIELTKSFSLNEKFSIEVINNKKTYTRYASRTLIEDQELIGIALSVDYEYEVNPSINLKFKNNESGPSGGLMTTLEIYNSLIPEDITKGYKIAGTGTIDRNGTIGPIGGVKYKIKGAVNSKADIFLIPKDNYEEALELKQKNNYKIEIISIETIDQALEYLNQLEMK